MRGVFIILSVVVAIASGQYNYQIGNEGRQTVRGLVGGFANNAKAGSTYNTLINVNGPNGPNTSPFQTTFSNDGFVTSSPSFNSDESAPTNQFITYTVDENDFKDSTPERVLQSVKKPQRVVFIKGPSNKNFEDAILALGKRTAQTAIYILSKQADINELTNKFNSLSENNNGNNRPEVHFVKYRTPDDAVNAQNAIQQQYNTLGGSSRTINGGLASSLNFASPTPLVQPANVAVPDNQYLPGSVLRL
ncbi:uncharacterized protein LOC133334879 [Musca vetustissima]|uniref:uncharacterized protein LOC133334879 n=1 Tax=Musca vetustissima TaxID=27455 RepID=UPI002AB649C8|nr:uncharacterized protein LOC133334879 [Musca vetustissima]